MIELFKSSFEEAGKALASRFSYYMKSCLLYFLLTVIFYFAVVLPMIAFNIGVYSSYGLFVSFITEILTMWALSFLILRYRNWFVGKNALDERFIAGISGFIVLASFIIAAMLFMALNLMVYVLPGTDIGPQLQSISNGMMSSLFLIPLSILIKFCLLYFFIDFNRISKNLIIGLDIFIILSFLSLIISAVAKGMHSFSIEEILAVLRSDLLDTFLSSSQTLFILLSGLALARDRSSNIFFDALSVCFISLAITVIVFNNGANYMLFFGLAMIALYLSKGKG